MSEDHCLPLILTTLLCWVALFAASRDARALVGDIAPVHDPSIIHIDNQFILFTTGPGIPILSSPDLFHWKRAGSVFQVKVPGVGQSSAETPPLPKLGVPAWALAYTNGAESLWAPDASFFHGRYHVYYAASTFGQTHSAVGLVTRTTLDFAHSDEKWVDCGPIVQTPAHNSYNAIDPAVFVQDETAVWMVFGSWWSGLKLVALDPATGAMAHPEAPPLPVACRPAGGGIEEGYLTRRGGFFYLWASFGKCCQGSKSTYSIRVGRSTSITGPYVDRDQVPMLQGGGSMVLDSYGTVRGPGSCAIVSADGKDWLVHHFYDAQHDGIPTLGVRPLTWTPDGWPMVGDPIAGPVIPDAATPR